MNLTKVIKNPRMVGVFLAMFMAFSACGQSMQWSNDRKLKGNTVFTNVIGENQHGIFLLRYRNKFFTKSIIIERYRHQLGLALSKSIVLKKARLLHVELQSERILVITSRFNRKKMHNEVLAQWFSMDVEPMGDPDLLFTAMLSDYYDKGDFRIRISNDRKRIMIAHTEKSKRGLRVMISHVFDKDLSLLYQKRWELSVSYEKFGLYDLMVDNFGNAYYLINDHNANSRKSNEDPLKWNLFWYSIKQDSLRDYQITDSSKTLMSPKFSWDRYNHKVNVTSFYSTDNPVNISGLFNFHLSVDSLEVKSTYHEFSPEFKSFVTGEGSGLTGEEVRNFKIIDILPNSDGGISLVAERSSFTYESDVTYVNGIPQTSSRNIYNYEDVLVMAVDPGLRIRWFHVVNKSQNSLNDGGYYSSVIVANTRSKLYLIYNDRLRTNGDVIQYTFTASGEMSNKILIRSEEDFVSVIPREAAQIAYNKLLLPVSKNKKFALLKLEYPN